MYALSFDMNIADLKEHYGEIYNNAYYEVRKVLIRDGFEWIQGSTYLTRSDNLTNLMQAIMDLHLIMRAVEGNGCAYLQQSFRTEPVL